MSRFVRCLRILSLFGLLLWSHEGFAADTIGNAIIISGTVMGTSVEGTRHLNLLNEIHSNEIIETFDDSAAELEFFDATTLSLGPNTRITLDRFVYDPDPQNGAFEFTVTQGALRFASGVLPSDSYKIHTPVVTIVVPFWAVAQAWPHVIYVNVEASGLAVVRCSGNLCQTVDCLGQGRRLVPGRSYVFGEEGVGSCVTEQATAQNDESLDEVQQETTDVLLASENPIPGRGPLTEIDTEFLMSRETNQAQALGQSQSISPQTLAPP